MSSNKGAEVSRFFSCIYAVIRASEWWNFKIPMALVSAFAAAWYCKISLDGSSYRLALILLAGITAAAYANILNDFMDADDDKVAGKANALEPHSAVTKVLFLTASVVAVVAVCSLLYVLKLYVSLLFYNLIVGAFTCYSVPPLRLKSRGLFGVLCSALSENTLPALLSMSLIFERSSVIVPASLTVMLAVWSTALGLRGIIWHQLLDYHNDTKSNIETLGVRIGQKRLRNLGERVVFPVEVVSLLAVLLISNNLLSWLFLAVHLFLDYCRCRISRLHYVIVEPQPDFRFALLDYYQVFLPFSFLIAMYLRADLPIWILFFEALLFAAPLGCIITDSYWVVSRILSKVSTQSSRSFISFMSRFG